MITQEKILEFLRRKKEFVSGDQMAARLGISRQALWKHIQLLKEAGYDIVAVPHCGYRLEASADRLFSFELSCGLNTRLLGRKICYFENLTSTMSVAMKLGLEGSAEGTLVVAESQTQGKGRLGRSWYSPKHKGLYFSLILRPKILPSRAPLLTILCAVGVCEAVADVTGLQPQIKWPNDILLQQKKIGGILTELNAETDAVNFAVVGIGLNVNNDKKSLVSGATSLKEAKQESVDRVLLLQEILRKIEKSYLLFQKGETRPILEAWRKNNTTLGRRVKVYVKEEHVEGQALDIDKDGGLLVRKDTGVVEKVMAGDVIYCRT
jgi:BirA family transcriptional regulator, biotin operon repressor / biotin---[acetyl-CoA-carboxylase] ligase